VRWGAARRRRWGTARALKARTVPTAAHAFLTTRASATPCHAARASASMVAPRRCPTSTHSAWALLAGRTECSQQSSTCLACLKASAVGQWYDGLDRCASGCGCDNMMMQAEWTNRWRCNSDTFHQCLPTVVQEANSGDLAWCRSRCGARPPGASTCNGSGPGTCWRVPPLSPWPPWPPATGCTVKPGSPPIYEK
jgi:hypothetical protein